MKILLPIFYACIAAVGNALFAYGQKQSAAAANGLLQVGGCALVAALLAFAASPLGGSLRPQELLAHRATLVLSGLGLFLTYLGFHLLYSRCGVASYVLYAVLSIATTTVFVGMWLLKEPMNLYHKAAVIAAVVAVVLYSLGQART